MTRLVVSRAKQGERWRRHAIDRMAAIRRRRGARQSQWVQAPHLLLVLEPRRRATEARRSQLARRAGAGVRRLTRMLLPAAVMERRWCK
jgi:hypothetical protein